jgi:hypothetical protein
MRFTGLACAACVALAAACSTTTSTGPTDPTTEQQAFSHITNVLLAPVSAGGASGLGFVDTGNPWVLLDPSKYPAAQALPATGGDVSAVTVASETAENVYVVAEPGGFPSPDPSIALASNAGCTAICSFVAAFDYQNVAFSLGTDAPTPPAGLNPETVVDFSFEGGSVLDGVTVPKSRVVVPVSIEGTMYTMIVDTGASEVTVSQAAFSAITKDGRPTVSGGSVETTTGTSTSTLARVSSISVGGADVSSVVISHDTSFDMNLADVSTDVGHTIDGSLGGTFLDNFFVTIDYPNTKLHLAPYSDTSSVVDPAEQIGIALAPQNGSYVVAAAIGDAASQGVVAGNVVDSIDGQELGGLGIAQASILLYGKVGSTKQVTFGSAGSITGQTLTLTVLELLNQ